MKGNTRRSLLCRVGLHRFRPWAFNSLLNPMPVERCERSGCGVGRQFHIMGAIFTYTSDQMREMAEELERREEEKARNRPPNSMLIS